MSNTCPRLYYQKTKQGLMLTACYGADGKVFLPDALVLVEEDALGEDARSSQEGTSYPITAIAPYAFSDRKPSQDDLIWEDEELSGIRDIRHLKTVDVVEIRLPKGIREIGRYAFYRCRNLKKLTLSDEILDIGGGALTGCRLEEVEIHFYHGEQSALKSIVDEVRFSIHARLYYENGVADILFPEHYEEAVENTPARILYTSHHGAGGYYRQCFYNRELDYKKYDALLPWAIAEEAEETVIKLSMGRLKYPYMLSETAKADYLAYIKEHEVTAAKLFVREEDVESIRFLSEEKLWMEDALKAGIDLASECGKTEMAGILMEEKHKAFPKKRKVFDL